ncbi:putative Bromodomain testis-specific protein [Xylariaceae sp. FL0662B]|nr:putative Bromodomain testis-specific protein [Xylariaceae sp. FL0662B]
MAEEAGESPAAATFSWQNPHPIFVIVLVGEHEVPFGIQKDFLCAKSAYFKTTLAEQTGDQIEHIVKLPQTTPEVFGLAQNFIFTGRVFADGEPLPGYELLIAVWKLGSELGIDGLCDEALEAMTECRRVTQHIPATPLLVQAWKDNPKGSSIRKLLAMWAAEYIRSSESREEFSESLPQEVLSDLVLVMNNLNTSSPSIQVNAASSPGGQTQRKGVHYLDPEDSDAESRPKAPKHRHSDVVVARVNSVDRKNSSKKNASRASLPTAKPAKAKRASLNLLTEEELTPEQKMLFCGDLMTRMLSGPGFWTRLVGPFREPVRPVEDGVPDYFDRIEKPMDLNTIKEKMDRGEYKAAEDFVADVRQIFHNCYTYWDPSSPMWSTCERFQKTFEEKLAGMPKWVFKYEGGEAT